MNIATKTIDNLEKRLTKTAHVLGCRPWHNSTFCEVDLHIPGAHLNDTGIHHIKCRVAPLTYRDYTISCWDADTSTCTLFIDAAHDGPGSAWAKTLTPGDTISYLKIECRRYTTTPATSLLLLGDQSALGHFLALQQLAGNNTCISGAIVMPEAIHRAELKEYYPELHVQPIDMDDTSAYTISRWLDTQEPVIRSTIYLAGNSGMVIALRQQLRVLGCSSAQINAQGFW